jgi:protein-disulfide isomerase
MARQPAARQDPNKQQAPRDERRESGRARRKTEQEQAARRNKLFWLGGAVAVAVLAALVLIVLNRPQGGGAPIVAAAPLPASIPLAGNTMGAKDAPVSIVEWGDYQCPSCGAFAREIAPRVVTDYVEPGKVQFTFRDFAFLGPESLRAAEAVACAADQNAFWPFHDTLYANQHGENQNAFSDARLKEMARTQQLDSDKFNRCLDSGEKQSAIEQSAAEARSQGINSTPSIFVNGAKVGNWSDWDALKALIDQQASKG